MKKITYVLLFYGFLCFGQENKAQNGMYNKWESIYAKNKNAIFYKTLLFYKTNNYDSIYIYSSKSLSNNSITIEEKDFFLFTLGYSAYQKELYDKALSCFSSISNDKDYELEILSKKGDIFLSRKQYEKAIFFTKNIF